MENSVIYIFLIILFNFDMYNIDMCYIDIGPLALEIIQSWTVAIPGEFRPWSPIQFGYRLCSTANEEINARY